MAIIYVKESMNTGHTESFYVWAKTPFPPSANSCSKVNFLAPGRCFSFMKWIEILEHEIAHSGSSLEGICGSTVALTILCWWQHRGESKATWWLVFRYQLKPPKFRKWWCYPLGANAININNSSYRNKSEKPGCWKTDGQLLSDSTHSRKLSLKLPMGTAKK